MQTTTVAQNSAQQPRADAAHAPLERVILTTGGTGGHIFPALAVADALKAENPNIRILFVGGLYGIEKELVPAHGIEFVGLPVRGILGKGIKAVGAVCAMLRALVKARTIVKKFRPQAVIGFGGYAAVSAVTAARLCGVPCAVHEQNSVAGMANRLLGNVVQRVFLSFPDKKQFFDARKTMLTGNPVRQDIFAQGNNTNAKETATPATGTQRHLLVMGGSLGARAINDAVLAAAPALCAAGVEIIHQTGKADFERVQAAYKQLNAPVQTRAFIDNMAEIYAWADIALCRSGASSVFELAAAEVPAIFVPFPHATHNHQHHNAAYLAEQGAALLVEQQELTAAQTTDKKTDIAALITSLFSDPARVHDMAQRCGALAKPHAADDIATALAELAAEKNPPHTKG